MQLPVEGAVANALPGAVPEEVKEEVATQAGVTADATAVASIWREFGRKPSPAKRAVDIVGSSVAVEYV